MVCSDGPDGLLVEFDGISQCQRCRTGKGCGAVLADSGHSGVRMRIATTPDLVISDGSPVLVEIDEQGSGWLWPVFGAYGLPLAGMLLATGSATAIVGGIVPHSDNNAFLALAEVLTILSAIGGLAAGLFAWRQLAPRALACAGRSLCLHSARIVAINPSSEREP